MREPGPNLPLRKLSEYEQAIWSKADRAEMTGFINQQVIEEVTKQSIVGRSTRVMFVRKIKPPDQEGRRFNLRA